MRDARPGTVPASPLPSIPTGVDPAEITSPDHAVTDAPFVAPAELAADYEVLGELGRGGSAVVYHARDRRLGREVALKVVRLPHGRTDARAAEALARLGREACTVAQLEHPNIVRLHAVHHLSDGLALEMPRVAGQTLKQVLADLGPLDADHTSAILRDVAAALEFAHARGVVHRDVKPENIFVEDYTGRALLADFGVACWQDADVRLTQTGVAIGTPAYMSPEQIDGRAVDGRADLYSLGLVGWEMLTGHRPWEGESLLTVLQRQQRDELPPIECVRPAELSPVPASLQYIVERMLQKAPAARWADAGAVAAQLAQPILPMDFAQWQRRHAQRVLDARRAPPTATPRPGALGRITTVLTTLRFSRARPELEAPEPPPEAADDAPTWAARPPLRRAARTRIAVASATAVTAATIALVVRSTGNGEEVPRRPATRAARGEVALPTVPPLQMPRHLGLTAAHGPSTLDHAFEWSPSIGPRAALVAAAAVAPAPAARTGGTTTQPPATAGASSRRGSGDARSSRSRGARATRATLHVHAPVTVTAPEGAGAAAPTLVATARDAVWRVAARVRGAANGEPVPVGAAGGREVVADSALSRAPRRAEVVGSWDHGDRRSRLGDSLTLVLREDGTAREVRRRYSLDPRNRWLLAREQRDGRWEMRYGGLSQVELCITWRTPKEVTTCSAALPDSLDGRRMLTYAGRHWRARPADADDVEKRPPAKRKRGGSRRG